MQSVLVETHCLDGSPMKESSPLHEYQDVEEDLPMHDDPLLNAPLVSAASIDIAQEDRHDTEIPDRILLEIRIPISSTTVVPDTQSLAPDSEKPVSHSTPGMFLEVFPF